MKNIINRVQALIAKAESSTYSAEADAFMAKAQELINDHAIDQARGYVFINYNPHYSSWEYAFWVGIVLTMVGLMGEFYTRQHVSVSWNARR